MIHINEFLNKSLINVQSTRRVDDEQPIILGTGKFLCLSHRSDSIILLKRAYAYVCTLCQEFQLLDCSGSLHISRDEQGFSSSIQEGKFHRRRCLSDTLKTDELRWNNAQKKILAEGQVRISNPQGVQTGIGLESSASLNDWTMREVTGVYEGGLEWAEER